MKGVSSLVSMVLYAAILLAAITLVVNFALPMLDRMQDSSAINGGVNFLAGMDEVVREVASGTEGASRTVTLTFQRGSYHFDNATGELYYEIDTESRIVATHAVQQRGPVELSADADVSVEETEVNGTDCYMMENQHIKACIRKIDEEFNESAHTGLVGFWRFNEGSGQWANDSSRYGNDATLGGSAASESSDPAWTTGIHSNGLDFDGSDDYMEAASPSLSFSDAVTITAWMNPERISGDNRQWIVESGNDAFMSYLEGSNSHLNFRLNAGESTTTWDTGHVIDTDSWQHVALVYNGSDMRAYVDGSLTGTNQKSGDLATVQDIHIGADAGESMDWYNGSLDGIRIYNRSLSSGEVEWLYLQDGDTSYANTSEMLVQLRNKDLDEDLNATLTTFVNENSSLQAGTGFTTADTGETLSRGRVILNVTSHGKSYKVAYDLLSGADFLTLRTSGSAADNSTHGLEMALDNRTFDERYIDDQQRSTGTYTDSDLDFGYGAGQSGGRVAGLVQGASFHSVGYREDAGRGRYGFNLTTTQDAAFLPFTEGEHGVIEDRENEIQGSIFGSGNFLGYPSPNFAYELTQEKTVRASISFEDIVLNGFDRVINQGTYDITVSNEGVQDGKALVNLTVD